MQRAALVLAITAVTWAPHGIGMAQPADVAPARVPEAIRFLRLLLQHPELLDPPARDTVDEIHRTIRQAGRDQKRADSTDPDAKAKAAAVQADGEKRLRDLLGAVASAVPVTFVGGKPVLAPAGPFTLPGDTGALLFRVDRGPGESHFSSKIVDFAEGNVAAVPVEASGTTWVLVGLVHVPRHRTTVPLSFVQDATTVGTTLIDLLTPEPGRLKLTVLSDDSGQPSPAMVRLVWKTDGQVRRPDNGIDLDPQFDHQGRPGARMANLPGKLQGGYWLVPGPIDMALPAGEWEATIRRGAEHAAVIDTFTVSPGQAVAKQYRPRRWVSMARRGWYSGDDHVHMQILGEADAQRMMTWAKAEDVHVSNIVRMGDIYRTYFEQRGFGKTHRVVDGDYVLSPGQEDPRTDELGHTLAMNISSLIHDTGRYYLYDWVFDEVHAQGGLTGYAHVLTDSFAVHRDMSLNIPKNKIDFVDLMQFFNLGTDLYYEFLDTGFKVTASAGSDVPWGGTIGEVRVYARTGPGPFDADRWFDAVRRGHTFVTDGPMVEFTVDDRLPGDQIDVKSDRPLRVKARVWGDPDASLPSRLDIVRNGETIKSIEPTDPTQTELKLEFDVDPANGFWIAARAEGADGTRAHTTPIYVVKPGLRFWKFEAVDGLIAKRLASLDEIAALVKDRTEKEARGEAETNLAYRELARQGPELMQRVEAARRIYEELRRVADAERAQRAAPVTR